MKNLLLSLLLFLLVSNPAYALIVTDNVDKDDFQYEVGYKFSSGDTAASTTSLDVATESKATGHNFYYTIPRDGMLVGMSVAGNTSISSGAATFDVTINETITGVQTVLEPTVTTVRSAVGISGAAGPQYAYIRQDRASTTVARGFKEESKFTSLRHDADHPYGKATSLTAGNRIGVQITTSSGYVPASNDYVVVIYVLE